MKLRLLTTFALTAALASAASDAPERLKAAAEAFKEVMGVPDRSIPQELLAKAYCVIIIPDLKKGAFIFGGQYGKGFAACRNDNGVGWSAPGAVRARPGERADGHGKSPVHRAGRHAGTRPPTS